MRWTLFGWAVVLLTGCRPPPVDLVEASRRLSMGAARDALVAFDALAARPDATARQRAEALTGAALACDLLGDLDGARARLERAIVPEVPGASEPALFHLAEHVRMSDRARALNLYYRAAAGAQKHRAGGFPYRIAMERILQLSPQPPAP